VRPARRDNPEHYSRARDVLSATRLALTSTVVAAGFVAVGLSGRVWAFIPAAIAAVFAVVDAPLAWRGFRAAEARELAELLAGNPCRASEARASEYGVDAEVLPEGQVWRYVHRDFERRLREAVVAALAGEGPRLVMLSGEAKSGKTRAAFQALSGNELKDAWLVVPRDGASVETLLRPGMLPASWTPLVVWLDDIERYASADAGGLHEGALRNLRCDRPVGLLATEGGRGSRRQDHQLLDPLTQLRSLASCIEVPVKLTKDELALVRQVYGHDLAGEIEQVGLGRRMVAIDEIRNRLTRSHSRCREGFAVIRAAVDWRRAGAQRPLSAEQLERLYRCYLPEDLDPDEDLFAAGMRWARQPLPNTEIALLRRSLDGEGGYEPYDLAVEVAAKEWPGIGAQAMAQIVALAEPQDCFQMASVAFDAKDTVLALDLLAAAERSEDRRLSATSAFNTGVLMVHAGDLRTAEAAYRRADERGSQRGAFNLGQLLRHRGDLQEAEAAYRRADERASPGGAVNLGFLLEQRGDLAGAEAAYRRAAERGSRKGASNLERLLLRSEQPAELGRLAAVEAAFDRAEEHGHVDV
jgi:tetratricopeptide (TPR) repeat protein